MIVEKDGTREETTTLWQDYEDGKEYQASTGLAKNLPTYVNFYEGRQWAKETDRTRSFPRPVFNIIEMVCRSKKATLLSVPARIVYKSDDDKAANVEKFNHFSDYIQKEIGQASLDRRAVEDGVKKGTYIFHYYWDSEAFGKKGVREGGLRCEIIDPLNIFFANPCEPDEQKQKWILIASREDVEAVRAKCDPDVDPETIASDESDTKYGTIEQGHDKLCTVLTRYFRRNGEVYCEIATKSVIVRHPFPVTPDVEGAIAELRKDDEDAPNNSVPDEPNKKDELVPAAKKGRRMTLYPVVVGSYKNREGSIFGISEVEGMIPVQKAINQLYGLSILNAQTVAGGKYVVHPKALRGQVINNEPGQALIDWTETGTGIKRLPDQPLQLQTQLADSMINLERSVTGSTEVMTGELPGSSLSGTAIAALQSQAQMPIGELRQTFFFVKEKQGRVLAEFFRTYYTEKPFAYRDKVPKRNELGQEIPGTEEEMVFRDVFSSMQYADTDYEVVAEATQGTQSSTAGDIALLGELFKAGAIGAKDFIETYPEDAISNKTELARRVEMQEAAGIQAMQQQLAESQQQLQNAMQVIQQQNNTVAKVQSVIAENQKLRELLVTLYTEAKAKIVQANQAINMGNAALNETRADAGEMAATLLQQQMASQNKR